MVKKIFQEKKPKRKNSEETNNEEIALYQKRMANLQDDFADRKISLEDYNVSIDRYRQKIRSLEMETKENIKRKLTIKLFEIRYKPANEP